MKRHLHTILLVVGAVALIGAIYAAFRVSRANKTEAPFATVTVERGDIVRAVSFTGTVVPATDAELSFERAGTVGRVAVKVGDKVAKGQVLASLSAGSLSAAVAQAEAGVVAAQARLDAIVRGARPEEIAVQDAQVTAAESAVVEARKALVDRASDAYAKADDAIRGKTDPFFIGATSQTPHLSFSPSDSTLASDLGWRRFLLEASLNEWQARVATLTAEGDVFAASADAKAELAEVSTFLGDAAHALDMVNLSANPGLSQGAVDGYKAGVSAARANIAASVSALSAGEEKIRGMESALALAKSQRTLKGANAATEDVAAQQAVVRQAQAAVLAAQAQMAKTVLRSPVAGTVAHVNVSLGEAASPAAVAVSVLSGDRYEIDALASETQIAAFAAGDAAAVTIDAYGTDTVFPATVVRVEPSPVTRNGQTGYPVTLRFDADDERVKVGMTANARISGEAHLGTLRIPRSAALLDESGATVLAQENGRFVRRSVKIGVTTDDMVEVTDGLAEGDVVADLGGTR